MTPVTDICSGTSFIIGLILANLMMLWEGSASGPRLFWSRKRFWLITIAEVTTITATVVLHEILVSTGTFNENTFLPMLVAALLIVPLVVAIRLLVEATRRAIKHE